MIILNPYLILKKKEVQTNYIAKDIFNFVKKFVKNTKESFDLETFIQNISNDGENFYNLIMEIMEKISDSNESVIESLRKIFIEKNLIKINEEIDGKEEEDNDEEKENLEENSKDKNCNLIND